MQISCSASAFLCLAIFTAFSYSARASEKPTMRALVAHEYGAPEVLKLEQVPRPQPKEDEALVRVIASGVNPADPLTLSGKYAREFGTHLPLIPGYDIAGVVEKQAQKSQSLKLVTRFTVIRLLAAAGQIVSRSKNGKWPQNQNL
jgi:NADPH:quinone reductase-like Zn-dependent oxidoreductase